MSTTTLTEAPTAKLSTHDERARHAIYGAFFTEFVDMFDIYLPVVVLAPVLFYFQPPDLGPGRAASLASLVFVTTLLGRPLGAIIFGVIADRRGRRFASIWSVAGFAVVTLLIALLPGYRDVGLSSYLCLIGLRFIDGIFLGGGYTASHPLALEYTSKSKRGFVGGLIVAAFAAAYVAISAVAAMMYWIAPLGGLESPYVAWGWRVPFVIGSVLAGILAIYYCRQVSESEIWKSDVETPRCGAPAVSRKRQATTLLQVLVLVTGLWTTEFMITLYMPSVLFPQILHVTGSLLTFTLIAIYTLVFFGFIAAGMIAQRIGRRRFFVWSLVLIATVGVMLYYVLSCSAGASFGTQLLLACSVSVLVTSPWGVVVPYISERFETGFRATGFGIGWSLSSIVPSFYAFYITALDQVLPPEMSPSVLLLCGSILALCGAIAGPETKDVDL
ncbi:MFS transporter [Bradyrhizobium mercantei]|uniref:MFS transporter n=1 Tax=Bradyrhizobium mercantei TaxID=1904807 RepID=UPI0009759C6F|nr:MFS transporter [Bradyrhizobium mercantei]